jgi:hypothetical protein
MPGFKAGDFDFECKGKGGSIPSQVQQNTPNTLQQPKKSQVKQGKKNANNGENNADERNWWAEKTAKDMQTCMQTQWTPEYVRKLKKYAIQVPGVTDTHFVKIMNGKVEWVPISNNSNTTGERLQIAYYLVPNMTIMSQSQNANALPSKQPSEFAKCFGLCCQGMIGPGYLNKVVEQAHFLVIACAEGENRNSILGFLGAMIKTQWEMQKYKEVESGNSHVVVYDKPAKDSEDDPIFYVDLICSDGGAGGRLLKLIEHKSFREQLDGKYGQYFEREFSTLFYEQISLEAVPDQYSYYTLKHFYMRTIDCRRFYPILDIYLDKLKQTLIGYTMQTKPELSKLLMLYEPDHVFEEDYFVLSKYIPLDEQEQVDFMSFVNDKLIWKLVPKPAENTKSSSAQTTAQSIPAQTSEQKGGEPKKHVLFNSKKYVLRKGPDGPFIRRGNTRVLLSSIRGKYRYVKT